MKTIVNFSFYIKMLFLVGLIVRFGMMALLEPYAQAQWFVPFLSSFWEAPSFDPWGTYFDGNVNRKDFPYGPGMLIALLPATALSHLLAGGDTWVLGLGLKSTLLLADLSCFFILLFQLSENKRYSLRLVWLYWLSPLVLGATYWAGQLDIIPITLLFVSFVAIRKRAFTIGGVFLALAVSAKFSMALALPFLMIYFLKNTRMQPYALSFFIPFCLAGLPLLALPVLSEGYRTMVLGTGELQRLIGLSWNIGDVIIFVTPIALALILYAAWRLSYLSYHLLTAFMALVTLTIILTTATPPGWFMWAVPFLLLHIVPADRPQRSLCYGFFVLVGVSQVLFWNPPVNLDLNSIPITHDSFIYSVWLSAIIACGAVLIFGILRNSFYSNEIFRFGKKPISIGIAGDSGTGKDTLAESLIGIFGAPSTVHISGDDYHLWDRKGALWQVMTHLNPRANDLSRFYSDVNLILDKKIIVYRRYQHSNGCFSMPVKMRSKNFCIVSGLHTLLPKILYDKYDVKIFLEMEEPLRIFFKCQRDSSERGHKLDSVRESIRLRKPDADKYIVPQSQNADIVFSVGLATPNECAEQPDRLPAMYLTISLRHTLFYEELARRLIASCGMQVTVQFSESMEQVTLQVDGDITSEDIEDMVRSILPEIEELLAVKPIWRPGIQGIMQLVVCSYLLQALKVNR